MISVVVLPKLGVHQAMRLFLTGARFTAAEARGYGLVASRRAGRRTSRRAVQDGGRRDRARRPERGRRKRSVSIRTVEPRLDGREGFAYAEAEIAELFASPEAAEGMMAFATKRKPSWASRESHGQRRGVRRVCDRHRGRRRRHDAGADRGGLPRRRVAARAVAHAERLRRRRAQGHDPRRALLAEPAGDLPPERQRRRPMHGPLQRDGATASAAR